MIQQFCHHRWQLYLKHKKPLMHMSRKLAAILSDHQANSLVTSKINSHRQFGKRILTQIRDAGEPCHDFSRVEGIRRFPIGRAEQRKRQRKSWEVSEFCYSITNEFVTPAYNTAVTDFTRWAKPRFQLSGQAQYRPITQPLIVLTLPSPLATACPQAV